MAKAKYKRGSMNISEQERTYSGFVDVIVKFTVLCVVVLLLMAAFLT